MSIPQDVQHVAWIRLPPNLGRCRSEDLAADLEMVVPGPTILEIAEGPEHLVAPKVLLPVAIAAGDNQIADILESRRGAMRLLGTVGAEFSDPEPRRTTLSLMTEFHSPFQTQPRASCSVVASSDSLIAVVGLTLKPAGPKGSRRFG